MTRLLWLPAAATALFCGGAMATSCRVEAEPAHEPVARQVWTDIAEFSFLTGLDLDDASGRMTLARNLESMPSSPSLKAASADWGTLRARIDGLADTVQKLGQAVGRLQQLCDQLDAVSLTPDAPLDEARWNAGVATVETEMDAAIAAAAPVVAQLESHASLLRVAAAHHARLPSPANEVVRLGPAPQATATEFSTLALRWRAVASDLANARRILPVRPVRGSSAPLIAMTAAMRELARISAEAHALSAQRLSDADFLRYESGDYLYDQCPMLKDRQWVALQNLYWSERRNTVALLQGTGLVSPPGLFNVEPLQISVPAMIVGADRWRFIRTGKGYWLVQNAAFGPGTMALDVTSVAGKPYLELKMTASAGDSPRFSGQQWRCAPSDLPGQFHLYNRFLSDAVVLDTAKNNGIAVMLPATSRSSGQYWRVIER
ncbi:MAG: RICIN domain-containing protein [Delftia acidovorans]|jgi:hypothetical protein|nr:RICIN domain-containing protein [Delftia acidovorans]